MAVTKMNPTFGKLASKAHAAVFKMSRGRVGGKAGKAPVLILTTTGRKSGAPRETPLFYVESEDGWAVTASNSGHDHSPAWFLNLQADPRASVRIGDSITQIEATVVDGPQRRALWDRLVAIYAGYTAYQEVTDRVIPVIELTPLER